MSEQVDNVNTGVGTEVNTGANTAPPVEAPPVDVVPEGRPTAKPNYAPNLLDQQPNEPTVPEEPLELTGLFNDALPEDLKGNVHIEGLFGIAKAQFPNLDLNRVLGRAWEEGDPNLIDSNYLREVAGEEYAQYYESYFQDLVESYTETKVAELNEWANKVFESVGGRENWDKITYVFNNTAPDNVVGVVKGLLDSNNPAERDAGIEMVKNFARMGGVMPQTGGKSVNGDPASSIAGAISALEYQQEIGKLSREGRLTEEGALEALRQRRLAGMRAGL